MNDLKKIEVRSATSNVDCIQITIIERDEERKHNSNLLINTIWNVLLYKFIHKACSSVFTPAV